MNTDSKEKLPRQMFAHRPSVSGRPSLNLTLILIRTSLRRRYVRNSLRHTLMPRILRLSYLSQMLPVKRDNPLNMGNRR